MAMYMTKIKIKPQKNQISGALNKVYMNFHSKVSWVTYREKHEKTLKKLKVRSVKVIFYTQGTDGEANYIVSLKRHDKRKSKKDGRYEFPGGKIDRKEKVLTALKREVSEEDDSGVLASQLRYLIDSKPQLIRYKVVMLKDETTRAIFLLPLKEKQWKELDLYYQKYNPDNTETYGFDRLDNSYFELTKETKLNWTPQTIKVLKALQRGD